MRVSCKVACIPGAFPGLPCIRWREIGVGFRHRRDPRRRGNDRVRALVACLVGVPWSLRNAPRLHNQCMFRAWLHAFPGLSCIRLREIGVGFRHRRDRRRRGNDRVRSLAACLVGCRGVFETHRECTISACFVQSCMHSRYISGALVHPLARNWGRFPTSTGAPQARERPSSNAGGLSCRVPWSLRNAPRVHNQCMFRAWLHAFSVHFRGSCASVCAKLESVSDIDENRQSPSSTTMSRTP